MTNFSDRARSGANDPFTNRDFDQLFKELYSPLCRFTMRFVIDKETAEDIVQDLFVYLWEQWERLSSISSIKSYLYTAAKNRSVSYLKRPLLKPGKDRYDNTEEETIIDDLPGPEELIAARELETILEKALEALPNRCRTIFALKRFGELSNKEIGKKLNISVKTVEAQMTIAIKRIMGFVLSRWQFILLFLTERLHNLIKN